jgi:DEAD/DEAH box helicase domain-containing protein
VSPEAIESYRSGYTPKERRAIEKALFSGRLIGLSATNAMELGVDVGDLDAVVMNGYPGSVSSFWQQAGRAGRGRRDGLAIMIGHDDPLEQFLIREPSILLDAHLECVTANPENQNILQQHLCCAAQEKPLAPSELSRFGDSAIEIAEELDRSGELQFRSGFFYYPSFEPPTSRVSLRGGSKDDVRLILDGQEIGTMERWRSYMYAHRGAIYLHRGSTYLVEDLDLDLGAAILRQVKVDYYTQAVMRSVLEQGPVAQSIGLHDLSVSIGGVRVTDLVEEFRRKSLDGDVVISAEPLDLPPHTYESVGIRFDFPSLTDDVPVLEQMGGYHGVEHALLAVAPLLAICDRGDLGSAWYVAFPDTLRPAVFIFDRTPGGIGLSEKLFESLGGWSKGALQLLGSCACQDGCPACLLSARCESSNENLHKTHAIRLLNLLNSGQPSVRL